MSVLSSLFKRILKGRGDDIAEKVAQNYGDDAIRIATNGIKNHLDEGLDSASNLIATHQISPEKLAQATEMGGFMHPSLAVTAPGRGGGTLNPSYGDIVMVANREQLMPKAGKAVIADRDIWSPTVPRGRTEVDEKALDRLLKANGVKASASNLVRFGDINLDSPREGLVGLYRAFKNKPDVGLADVVDTDDYKDFVKNIADKIAGNRVFEHQTASGNWVTKPYTPENIDRFLSSGGAINRTGWYLDGKDALLSQTRRFKSPTPLYGQANRLMDKELSEPAFNAILDNFSDVLEQMGHDGVPKQYDPSYALSEMIAGNLPVAKSVRPQVDDLRTALKNIPVPYFEAKLRRIEPGSNFYGALVPDDVSGEVMDNLGKLGVKNIQPYNVDEGIQFYLGNMAKRGRRLVNPYVLGLGGAGVLSSLFSGQNGSDNA
jgi:hypothetical protein